MAASSANADRAAVVERSPGRRTRRCPRPSASMRPDRGARAATVSPTASLGLVGAARGRARPRPSPAGARPSSSVQRVELVVRRSRPGPGCAGSRSSPSGRSTVALGLDLAGGGRRRRRCARTGVEHLGGDRAADAAEVGLAGRRDRQVDRGVLLLDVAGQAGAHRVGQHQPGGQEGDADDHRQGGGDQPGQVGPEALERVAEHRAQSPSRRHGVEDRVPGRGHELVDDPAVGQEQHPAGVGGGDRVVGDHHDGLAEVAHGGGHERQDLGGGVRVQVAGRLVGEDDLGPLDQRPGHRDPLLLAAGELRRLVVQPVAPVRRCATTWSIHSRSGLRPARSSGNVMFSSALSVGSRLNCWKMKPTLSRRSRVSCFSLSVVMSTSPIHADPLLSRSRPAAHCISVDLPEPDGPMMAVNRPARSRRSRR